MKKRKRLIWVFASATLLAVFVGALFYLATREHPDYVRAAKLLPDARQRAWEVFGALTWEEYREEHGIIYKDDYEEWSTAARSIARDVSLLANDDSAPVSRFADAYSDNEAWFRALRGILAPLELHEPSIGEPHLYPRVDVKNLINAIGVGIEGSAVYGDDQILADLTLAAWRILEQHKVEPSYINASMIMSGRKVISEALLLSAVRRRDDNGFLELVSSLLYLAPGIPSIVEAAAGSARFDLEYVVFLRSLDVGELNSSLDVANTDWGATTTAPSLLEEKLDELLRRLRSGKEPNTRHAGVHTVDALEARMWEAKVEQSAAEVEALSHEQGSDSRLLQCIKRIENESDRSFELAQLSLISDFPDRWKTHGFLVEAARVSVDLISKYQDHRLLPEALPIEMSFEDPYGGTPVLYKKTETGFIIYSRSTDGIDGGYIPTGNVALRNVAIAWSQDDKDYGIVVNYLLPIAQPTPE